MGRTVVADDSLQVRLYIIAKSAFQIGVLIGQFNKDKDYLIHVAPTPAPEDEPESCSDGEDESHKRAPPPQVPDSIATVDEVLVTQHARQVIRMLPGGLDIVGLFVATPSPDFASTTSQSKLRVMLNNIHKAISKGYLGMEEPNSEKLLLHLCTQSHKFSLRTVPLSQPGVPLIPTELKFQKGIRWQQLNYSYQIALTLWLPKDRSAQALYKLFVNLIRPWAESIKKSIILIDGVMLNKDDLVDPNADEKPPKKKGGSRGLSNLHPPKVFHTEIYDVCEHQQIFPPGKEESSGCVRFNGTIAGRAFIKPKAVAEEAFEAVRCDLVRSVVSRWEMHCDSLVDEPSSTTGPVVHEPPRRVFLEGGGLPVSLCDYLFPGDTPADACQSALELLDVTVSEDNVDSSLECLANVEEVLGCTHGSHLLDNNEQSSQNMSSWTNSPINYIFFVIAICVLCLSVAFSYFSTAGSKKVIDYT